MIQLQQFIAMINVPVMVMYLFGGIAATRFLTKWNMDGAWKTMIVGSFFVGIYVIAQLIDGSFAKGEITSYAVSYCFVTSLYELILKYFMDWIQGVFQKSK